MANLANHYSLCDNTVTLITFDDPGLGETYILNPKVEQQNLFIPPSKNILKDLFIPLRRIFRLHYLLKRMQPDAVLSFMTPINIYAIISCIGIQTRCIVSERIDPGKFTYGLAHDLLRKLFYPFATRIVVQTEKISGWFACRGYTNLSVIPNYVWDSLDSQCYSTQNGQCYSPQKCVLAIGRLTKQKGFDTLIKSFAQLAAIFPDWQLLILGEGEERNLLEELITSLAIDACVKLIGWVAKPAEYLRMAEIYTQPSQFEGFPNALLEAMAFGLPAISTHQAVDMLIEDGVNGLLVPAGDVNQLTSALRCLIENPELRTYLGKNALKVRETYSQEKVMSLWDKTLFPEQAIEHIKVTHE